MNWITNSVLPKVKALVNTQDVPENLWMKCKSCGQMIFHRDFEQAYNCCSTCGNHAPLPPKARFDLLFGESKFETIDLNKIKDDPLKFRDSRKTGVDDAIAVAIGKIGDKQTVVAAFDFRFMGGSMGRMVGNGIIAASRLAVERKAALITIPSTGGARMQEGILSLMQLPRTILAVENVRKAGLPHLVLLAHPTTGGVTASFAMLYLLEHGMVDAVVSRAEQPEYIERVLGFLMQDDRSAKAA